MPLNISTSQEDFQPIVKYNAKAGRWYIRNEAGDDEEVVNMTALFDFHNIQTGWLHFAPGAAPDWVPDASLGSMSARPSEEHKRGFKVYVYSDKALGGTREFMSSSMMANAAITKVYSEWEGKKTTNCAVIKCDGATPITGKHGTNYEPVLKLVKTMPRPADMAVLGGEAAGGVGASTAGQASKSTPTVSPPAVDEDDEFA